MNHTGKQLASAIAAILATPSLVMAQGFYATAQLGSSQQANDSTPYGNNIASDADFPGSFDAGNGIVGGVGIGYQFSKQLRVEGRIGHHESDFDDRKVGTGSRAGEEYILNGDIKSTTLTVEVFYDFPNASQFTPYVKAGVGVSDNRYSARLGGAGVAAFDPFDGVTDGYYDNYKNGDNTEFTWNVGVGGSYALTKQASIYGEYQYASFGDVSTGQDAFTDGFKIDDAASHEVALGVRVNF
ncbi:Opacity protein [Neptunomonas qingdaonensis]|uniref:Opacity protein n=2 Tax=Neptunomonas qingdaonensis TaxID=1045558 RepID=A0A1I2WHH2_9GAMM|nr:Opacity protein [Neptunomonas qingdaonensis]